MIHLVLDLTNEEADALRVLLPEIRKKFLVHRMSTEWPDKKTDSATPTYMVFERMLRVLGQR